MLHNGNNLAVIYHLTSGQSNFTTACIADAHAQFSGNEGTLAPPGEYK